MKRICLAGLLALTLLVGGTSPPVGAASPARGVDVSVWNAPSTTLFKGRDLAFIRFTYGTYKDTYADRHLANCRKVQLKFCGAYGFGVYGSGRAQAIALMAAAPTVDAYVLDLEKEWDRPMMLYGQAQEFIDTMHAAGRKVGLYHSLSGFPDLGQDWNWVAYWGPNHPPIAWTFWQYRGSPLDLNEYHGTRAELAGFIRAQKLSLSIDAKVIARGSNAEIRTYIAFVNGQMEKLEGYIRNLSRLHDPSAFQKAEEATYRSRLAALVKTRTFLADVIHLRGYIANLSAVKHPTRAQAAKLTLYRARLAAWLA